jgi:hypothetical protein
MSPTIIARSGPDTLLVKLHGTAVAVEFEPGTDAVWLVGYALPVGSYLEQGYWRSATPPAGLSGTERTNRSR